MSVDIGLTHIALNSKDINKSVAFYSEFAGMSIVHERIDEDSGIRVVWLSDNTRPFVIVLVESDNVDTVLKPFSHMGIGCKSKEEVNRLCDLARKRNILIREPTDSGYPIGYWSFIKDPDGHTIELSFGQEIGLTVMNENKL